MGYRYLDPKNLVPLLPFGHGLSYTSFQYAFQSLALEPGVSGHISVTLNSRAFSLNSRHGKARLRSEDIYYGTL